MRKIITLLIICVLVTGCMTQEPDIEHSEESEPGKSTTSSPPSSGDSEASEDTPPDADIQVLYQFAPYVSIPVATAEYAPQYSFDPDNLERFSLSPEQKTAVLTNGFVVMPSGYRQFFQVFKDCRKANIPIYVTTDSVLHTYHILYDYTLRILETEHFAADLVVLTQKMVNTSMEYYTTTGDEAALKNAAYFCVAGRLLDDSFDLPSHPELERLVTSELALIRDHAGFSYSPIFGYKEDYSQYVPRGHYTRSETLQKYFRAMMWYGRIMFRLKSQKETLQALYIVAAIKDTKTLELWDTIYQPTVFFVGKTDDLSIYEYTALAVQVYGPNFTIQDLQDEQKLHQFIEKARELRDPRIVSSWVKDYEDTEEETKSFRFMGQRFIPDSYIFQQLVYDKVGTPEDPRLFPKGLDVMAVLQSKRALEHLEPEKKYFHYQEQMDSLKEEFSALDQSVWTQNLYWMWLYTLIPLLQEKSDQYPPFMQSDAWTDKALYTALGSWTELRHDTILYAKQSYTLEATAIPSQPELTRGYVEPYPHVYARLASLARMMREGLEKRGLLLPEYSQKLHTLETVLLQLKTISEKELAGENLTEKEYKLIWNFGDTLESLTTFETAVETETDESVAIVADVHTDVNTGKVLEEGVGNVFVILVVVHVEGRIYIVQGGVFSYYEFLQPLSNRLTDEEWQTMKKPPLPQWTHTFIIH